MPSPVSPSTLRRAMYLPTFQVQHNNEGTSSRWMPTAETTQELATRWQQLGATYTHLNPRQLPLDRILDYEMLLDRTATNVKVHLFRQHNIRVGDLWTGTYRFKDLFNNLSTTPHNDASVMPALIYFPKRGAQFVPLEGSEDKRIITHPHGYYRRGGVRLTAAHPDKNGRRARVDIPLSANEFTLLLINSRKWLHSGIPPSVQRINPQTNQPTWVSIKGPAEKQQWPLAHPDTTYQRNVYVSLYGHLPNVRLGSP